MSKSRVLWLSVGAAVVTITLKFAAYALTGSMGLLSDATESVVNLAAAVFALVALQVASQPPDHDHHFGHDKAEYFSSGAEGGLILIAAGTIIYSAIRRLLFPTPIEQLGWGLFISVLASGVNWGVAQLLFRAARRYDSITLEADARHLMTDVWTTGGVVAGLMVVMISNWHIIDAIIAIAVALNIVRTGANLVLRSAQGLMDYTLPNDEVAVIEQVLARYQHRYASYHALRMRKAGPRRFVDLHLLVPGEMTVRDSHILCEQVEVSIKEALGRTIVTIHVEPVEDAAAWDGERQGGLTSDSTAAP
jgi:cation diffusion facilitator family transporter